MVEGERGRRGREVVQKKVRKKCCNYLLGIIYKLLEGSRGDVKEVVRKKDKKKFKKKFEKSSNKSSTKRFKWLYCGILHNGRSMKKVQKKFEKKFEKMFEKKFAKKVWKYYKLSEEGREGGREGGELSFQCLRPSTSLMAAGKNMTNICPAYFLPWYWKIGMKIFGFGSEKSEFPALEKCLPYFSNPAIEENRYSYLGIGR
jgi:hypothetical protein